MALKKCDNCGVFFGGDDNLCTKCKFPNKVNVVITGDVEHDKFTNARALVYDRPNITPDELVTQLKEMGIHITIREIMDYVKAGRLSLATDDGGSYCHNCGKRISIGTMCSVCSDKLEVFRRPTKEVQSTPKVKSKGMHISKG